MEAPVLLTRDDFRWKVFARSASRCVFCGAPAQDAHHIIERRLWPDGGYYLDNGAAVCAEHHWMCETGECSVEDVRLAAGITRILVPPHLYADQPYDKWGNPVLTSGEFGLPRYGKGELFYDPNVQRALTSADRLQYFDNRVKYPRTYHLPWSEGATEDDRFMAPGTIVDGAWVVVTEKMDGENTTMYRDYIHARSIDGRSHPSRDWVKNFWNQRRHDIPEGWRICGENLYAQHSIQYTDLPTYFLGFSIWNAENVCLSWQDTREWFALLNIDMVPELYRGPYNEAVIRSCWDPKRSDMEGYVVRVERPFNYCEFRQCVGKFVRANHVQTVKHWMHGQAITPNGLWKG